MKQIIESILVILSIGTFMSLGLMWSINQWAYSFEFEPLTFWQSSSILLLIFIITMIGITIKNILNYQK